MADKARVQKKPMRRKGGALKWLRRFLFCALVLYIFVCAFLYFIQNNLTYAAANAVTTTDWAVGQAKAVGLVPWDHTTPGASAPQGYVRPDFSKPTPRGTIVFFHGNGEYAWFRPWTVEALSRRGFRVFLYEYPGYGGRPGKPSESAIVPDAQALIRSLKEAGYGPIYVWGESLGAGVASAVCADESLDIKGLALISPWDNIANVGLSRFPYIPVRLLMIDRYDSVANLQHFGHPICITRGDLDETVLPRLTLNLYTQLPEPKKMILKEGYGHNNWPSDPAQGWWDDVLDFIAPK
jgi:alpha-beta hydrolase superfamily lysophospholipase